MAEFHAEIESNESPWTCVGCGTGDRQLRYSSGKMKKCKDCQRYYNLTVNAVKVRKHGRQPSLRITRDQFLEWARSGERRCHYCGVSEADLPKLNLKSSIGLPVEALGLDRLDNDGDYTTENVAFCCYACNKAKGNVFTTAEMELIGRSIAEAWRGRLG